MPAVSICAGRPASIRLRPAAGGPSRTVGNRHLHRYQHGRAARGALPGAGDAPRTIWRSRRRGASARSPLDPNRGQARRSRGAWSLAPNGRNGRLRERAGLAAQTTGARTREPLANPPTLGQSGLAKAFSLPLLVYRLLSTTIDLHVRSRVLHGRDTRRLIVTEARLISATEPVTDSLPKAHPRPKKLSAPGRSTG